MLDLLRKYVIGDTLDAQMGIFSDTELATRRLSTRFLILSLFIAPTGAFMRCMMGTAMEDEKWSKVFSTKDMQVNLEKYKDVDEPILSHSESGRDAPPHRKSWKRCFKRRQRNGENMDDKCHSDLSTSWKDMYESLSESESEATENRKRTGETPSAVECKTLGRMQNCIFIITAQCQGGASYPPREWPITESSRW